MRPTGLDDETYGANIRGKWFGRICEIVWNPLSFRDWRWDILG